jgi:hypothetical protein
MTPKADTYIVPTAQATKPTNGMHAWDFFYFDYFLKNNEPDQNLFSR